MYSGISVRPATKGDIRKFAVYVCAVIFMIQKRRELSSQRCSKQSSSLLFFILKIILLVRRQHISEHIPFVAGLSVKGTITTNLFSPYVTQIQLQIFMSVNLYPILLFLRVQIDFSGISRRIFTPIGQVYVSYSILLQHLT